jgi:hypothetical protein
MLALEYLNWLKKIFGHVKTRFLLWSNTVSTKNVTVSIKNWDVETYMIPGIRE